MKMRVGFQVLDILDAAGRKVINDIDLMAMVQAQFSQMRPNKTGPAGNQDFHKQK
jgi:hypothetical protein